MITLAIDGGQPVCEKPFAPWPHFTNDETESAAVVLRSGKVNYWTGQQGRAFEKEFAAAVGCKHAVAVANGSVALEAALYALGIGPGDDVIVPSRTFIASASCAMMRGAKPIFADLDPETQNITVGSIKRVLSPSTKAIVVVHLAGLPCDMDSIMDLAREHGLKVVEDCAQAQGARYHDRSVGTIGDVAAFSFCQDKIITTAGEGGMVTTNDDGIWKRAWSFKDHGKDFERANNGDSSNGFRWLHDNFGTNGRLTEFQSALGRVLLRKLPAQIAARRRNAAILSEAFAQIPALRVLDVPPGVEHAYYKYYVFIRPEMLKRGWDRDRIMKAIAAEGVPCFSGSCSEVYLEQAFSEQIRPSEPLPVARELGQTSLMFLVHPTLTKEDMLTTCSAVEKVLRVASSVARVPTTFAARIEQSPGAAAPKPQFAFLDLKAQYASIREEVLAATQRVLDDQHFIMGPEVDNFEREFAASLSVKHAISCASGSDALLLGLTALGIEAGDEVITTPFTFVATAGAIARLGARPVFVDIDPQTFNIDPRQIENAVTARTRAIMPVHLFGLSAEMDAILEIANARGLPVVEDAAQAVGSKYHGKMVGTIGDCGCFSFFPSKNLGGAGDGGLITTNNDALAKRLRLLRVHGSSERYRYEVLGINSRLDALQAAILRVKLPYLESWTAARQRNADRYRSLFHEYGLDEVVQPAVPAGDSVHVYNQFVVRIQQREKVREHLRKNGVPTDVYYPHPLHLQPAFAYLNHRAGDFPVSELASEQVLALPVYPELTEGKQRKLVSSIAEFLHRKLRDLESETQAA